MLDKPTPSLGQSEPESGCLWKTKKKQTSEKKKARTTIFNVRAHKGI